MVPNLGLCEKAKQSKRMNAISLDNSLHFSGSPFAFLETFSLDRGTPMYLTTQQLESKVHLHKTTFPLLAHIAHCTLWNIIIYRHCTVWNIIYTDIAQCAMHTKRYSYRFHGESQIYCTVESCVLGNVKFI